MNFKKYSIKFAIAAVFILAGCANEFNETSSSTGQTIVQIASANDNFNILTAALTKVGLANSFDNNNAGAFTVFAPTDDAFLAYFNSLTDLQLPPGAAAAGTFTESSALAAVNLLAPSYTPAKATAITTVSMTGILLYHVVSSEIKFSAFTGAQGFTTFGGTARLSVSKSANGITLNANRTGQNVAGNGAQSVSAQLLDIDASNGVIHAIDKVLIPVANNNIWIASLLNFGVNYGVSPPAVTVYGTTLRRVPPVAPSTTPGPINLTDAAALAPVDAVGTNYNLLSMAIARAELATVIIPISTPLPDFTVFAPTDAAFISYLGVADEAAARTAINNLSPAALADLVRYHVVPGRIVSTDLSNGQVVTTALAGGTFTINISGSVITLKDKRSQLPADLLVNPNPTVTSPNILTNAGVIHQINGVLRNQ